MAKLELIDRRAPQGLSDLSPTDALIALPTFNNEATIATVLASARAASLRFPGIRTVIVHVDGGSTDSTIERARAVIADDPLLVQMSYPLYPVHQLEVTRHPVPGIESAYRVIFGAAEQLGVRACCIVAADDGALQPDSIAALLQPVLDRGEDLVAPVYQRGKHEGLLVGGILYPMVRAIYGTGVRQPVGEDFGYSRTLIRHCLDYPKGWSSEAARQDVSLWITLQAVQADLKLCQVRLGCRPRLEKSFRLDVSSLLSSLVGGLFAEIERTAEIWQRVRESRALEISGRDGSEDDSPTPDVSPMIETFQLGYQNLQEIWGLVLPPGTLLELKRLVRQPEQEFRFASHVWARIMFDFALAYRLRTIGRDHLLGALTPLYLGWLASFILRTREMSFIQVEQEIESLCMTYESQKPYLISRWRWPDRFMP